MTSKTNKRKRKHKAKPKHKRKPSKRKPSKEAIQTINALIPILVRQIKQNHMY